MDRPQFTERWHPRTWSDFIGQANRRAIDRLQSDRIAGRVPKPILIVGPYGSAKTELARFLVKAYCCLNVSEDGNPCHGCDECVHQGRDTNGDGERFRHYEFDCTRLRRSDVIENVNKIEQDDEVASFWDELHRLRERDTMECLLTAVNDAHGLFIAAITDDKVHTVPPPLFERFRKIWLAVPSEEEFVRCFQDIVMTRAVTTDRDTILQMVRRTERSFRTCLDIVDAAASNLNRALDLATIDEFVTAKIACVDEVLEDDILLTPEDIYDD